MRHAYVITRMDDYSEYELRQTEILAVRMSIQTAREYVAQRAEFKGKLPNPKEKEGDYFEAYQEGQSGYWYCIERVECDE